MSETTCVLCLTSPHTPSNIQICETCPFDCCTSCLTTLSQSQTSSQPTRRPTTTLSPKSTPTSRCPLCQTKINPKQTLILRKIHSTSKANGVVPASVLRLRETHYYDSKTSHISQTGKNTTDIALLRGLDLVLTIRDKINICQSYFGGKATVEGVRKGAVFLNVVEDSVRHGGWGSSNGNGSGNGGEECFNYCADAGGDVDTDVDVQEENAKERKRSNEMLAPLPKDFTFPTHVEITLQPSHTNLLRSIFVNHKPNTISKAVLSKNKQTLYLPIGLTLQLTPPSSSSSSSSSPVQEITIQKIHNESKQHTQNLRTGYILSCIDSTFIYNLPIVKDEDLVECNSLDRVHDYFNERVEDFVYIDSYCSEGKMGGMVVGLTFNCDIGTRNYLRGRAIALAAVVED